MLLCKTINLLDSTVIHRHIIGVAELACFLQMPQTLLWFQISLQHFYLHPLIKCVWGEWNIRWRRRLIEDIKVVWEFKCFFGTILSPLSDQICKEIELTSLSPSFNHLLPEIGLWRMLIQNITFFIHIYTTWEIAVI